MIISDEYKFVFLHIPKCAGSSIATDIFNNIPDAKRLYRHSNAEYSKKYAGNKWNKYFKFTFVRNPFDRQVSWYFHIVSHIKKGRTEFIEPENFEWFIKYQKEQKKNFEGVYYNLFQSQFDFLGGENLIKDIYIGKFENLQNDWNDICKIIGVKETQLQHKNKTDHKHYRKYYNDELKEIMNNRFRDDLEYFNYEY